MKALRKVVGFAIVSILGLVSALDYKGMGFKKVNISCGDVIDVSDHFKTLLECCSFCAHNPDCQAVKFKGKNCTTMKNIGIAFKVKSYEEAWVELELYKFLMTNINERESHANVVLVF